jgi:hypothetical protein
MANVNHSRTIAHMQAYLPPLVIDALPIAKKVPESTEFSTVHEPPSLSLHHSSARSKRSLRESQGQFLR